VNKKSYAPGGALVAQLDLGDAIYRKLAAKQIERAADHALEAQRQDSVPAAARCFELALAQAPLASHTLRKTTGVTRRRRTGQIQAWRHNNSRIPT
jgi:hypothetical protein